MKYRTIYASGLLDAIKGVCLSLEMIIDCNGIEVDKLQSAVDNLERILGDINAVRNTIDR